MEKSHDGVIGNRGLCQRRKHFSEKKKYFLFSNQVLYLHVEYPCCKYVIARFLDERSSKKRAVTYTCSAFLLL